MKVPPATNWSQRSSYSSCEPSTQWMEAGLVRAAILSTQFRRWVLVLSGVAEVRALACILRYFRTLCEAGAYVGLELYLVFGRLDFGRIHAFHLQQGIHILEITVLGAVSHDQLGFLGGEAQASFDFFGTGVVNV